MIAIGGRDLSRELSSIPNTRANRFRDIEHGTDCPFSEGRPEWVGGWMGRD